MKIGIYYGSTTGNTQAIAEGIGRRFEGGGNEVTVKSVGSAEPAELSGYDLLVLGSSTWGVGELQDDWDAFLPKIASAELADKNVAFFGTGDQSSWADSFLDAVGILYEEVAKLGVKVVGSCPVDGYDFSSSRAVVDGQFVGMAFDEDNQSDQTESRINEWVDSLLGQVG